MKTNLRASDLAACKTRIADASKVVKVTGKAKGGGGGGGVAAATGGPMSCQGGAGMTVTTGSGGSGVFVNFIPAAQGANSAQPGPGQCAWSDRPVAPGEPHRLAFLKSAPNAQLLLQAVTGGTFQVKAQPISTFLMVSSIDNVQVVDSTPLSPGPAGGNDAGGEQAALRRTQEPEACQRVRTRARVALPVRSPRW